MRIHEGEIGNWPNFSRTVGQKFRRVYQICNLNVHRSIYKYHFFLSVFFVSEMFLNLERKSCHTWRFFLQFSQNCLRSQRNILRWSVFSQKGFVFLLKVYGKVTKKFLFFCSEINAGGLNCNLYFKRSNPRIFLTKKLKVCCDKQFRTFGRKFRYDCQKSIQH